MIMKRIYKQILGYSMLYVATVMPLAFIINRIGVHKHLEALLVANILVFLCCGFIGFVMIGARLLDDDDF